MQTRIVTGGDFSYNLQYETPLQEKQVSRKMAKCGGWVAQS